MFMLFTKRQLLGLPALSLYQEKWMLHLKPWASTGLQTIQSLYFIDLELWCLLRSRGINLTLKENTVFPHFFRLEALLQEMRLIYLTGPRFRKKYAKGQFDTGYHIYIHRMLTCKLEITSGEWKVACVKVRKVSINTSQTYPSANG